MKIIICDIDNTILEDGHQPMQNVIGWLEQRKNKYKIVLVTGRLEGDRKRTIEQLEHGRITFYDKLIMNDRSVGERFEFKGDTARKLNKDGKVVLAIDNSRGARLAYEKAGIKNVIHPNDISDDLLKKDVWGGTFLPRNGIGMI